MTIRLKIQSIAFVFLVIFGIVIGVSAWWQRRLSDEVYSTFQYNTPIRTLISDFDVRTDEYELIVLRLVRRTDVPQSEIENEIARAREDAAQMTDDLRQVRELMDRAMGDTRLPAQSRLGFSAMSGSLPFIERHLPPFLQTGDRVLQAIADNRFEEARTLSLEFRKTEDAFGPDTAAIRTELAELQMALGERMRQQVTTIAYFSFGLFILASALGIGVGAMVAGNIVRTLRRLVDVTQAVEAGNPVEAIPVPSRDEVGQLATAFNHMLAQIRSKQRIEDAFGKFVDPRIVTSLVSKTGDIEHADRQIATVFFSDIAGFTSICEELTATAIVKLLNHYFAAVTESIRASNGIVDKFIGDGLMAFWAAPFSPADAHAASACLSALAQQEAVKKFNEDIPNILGLRRNAPTLTVRIGIATGEVVLGTIGSAVSKSFTVIGDTVNLASRLESVNKVFGTRIIVAEPTVRLAAQAVECRELDLITVVGKTEPVRIYEVLGPAGTLTPEDTDLLQEFGKGLTAYRAREWDRAVQQFQQCLKTNPKDVPSALYVDRIATLREQPPPADWDGVWRFTLK
jgi:adenylate cyclase